MPQTVIEKITEAHAMGLPSDHEVRAGDYVTVRPDHVMTHDNTSAVIGKFKGLGASRMHDPRQPVFTLDHNIQDMSEENQMKYEWIHEFSGKHGVDFYPAGRGIGHQVMIEEGYVRPGGFVVASDSHSNMYGAVGAVGTPVVRTDAAVLWATGTVWWQVPRSVKVTLTGKLPAGASGKDVIITLCGLHNQGEVLNAAVEFCGPGVAGLSLEARLTISNMTTEWGALVGWFPVDEITLAWFEDRLAYLDERGIEDRLSSADVAGWRGDPPQSDPDAMYAAEITLNLDQVSPHVSGPDTVQTMTSVADMAERKVAIQKAYLVSCVNSRTEDLAAAADVLRGKRVADGVEFYVAAASRLVEQETHESGVWQDLLDAGAKPLPPGCGPCIGLGAGLLEPGEVGISATNRNFKGRMGTRDAQCYLASPAVVAASAVAGHITGPAPLSAMRPERSYRDLADQADGSPPGRTAGAPEVEILPEFPARFEGRALWLPVDNLNTDGIYGKDYTYRDDITPEMMAEVLMENYDPGFAALVRPGDVVVGGYNFGTGSSREQAATAFMAAKVGLVIAGSFSQTYLRNAFNNGFTCLVCSGLVDAMRGSFAAEQNAGSKTIVCEDMLAVDVATSMASWRGKQFACTPLGAPVQELVIAGGVENLVRKKLAGS